MSRSIINTAAVAAENIEPLILTLRAAGVTVSPGFSPTLLDVTTANRITLRVTQGHNHDGWEAVIEPVDGEQHGLPDGPGEAGTVYEVATWVARLVDDVDRCHLVRQAFNTATTAITTALGHWQSLSPRHEGESVETFLLDPGFPFDQSLDEVQARLAAYCEALDSRLG